MNIEDYNPDSALTGFCDINLYKYLTQVRGLKPETEEFGMEGFDFVLNALPVVRVKEEDGIITVGGFWARDLERDVERAWGTKRVSNSIFLEMSVRQLKFHSFFALEVIYMLEKMKGPDSRTRNSTIDDLIKAIYENTWVSVADKNPPLSMNYSKLKRMSVSLLPAQNQFLEAYSDYVPKLNLRGLLAAMPPGTGKTITGFAWHLCMDMDVTFFIVPKNSREEVWEETILSRFKRKPKYWTSKSKTDPTGREEFIICHYEALARVVSVLHKFRRKKIGVWLDESHNFNEMKSQRTQLFVQLCLDSKAEGVVWASGTPLKAIGKEAVPLLRTIDPMFTEDVERDFVGLYGATVGRALDVLNHRLSKMMFKIEKTVVVNNPLEEYTLNVTMPGSDEYTLDHTRKLAREFIEERIVYYKEQMPQIEQDVRRIWSEFAADLSKVERGEFLQYKAMCDEMHRAFDPFGHKDYITACKRYENEEIIPTLDNEDKKLFKRAVSRYKYVVLVIRGEVLGLVLTRQRIRCLVEMVQHTPFKTIIDQSEKKTLIFTSFVEVADQIVDYTKHLGYKPLVVYGGTNKDLSAIMDKFKRDSKANPMIATYPSLSTAVPVIEANTCVLYDMPFRDYIKNQATSRVNRLGQDSKVHIVNVLLDTAPLDNLTTRAGDILKWSKEMVDSMLGTDEVADNVGVESLNDVVLAEFDDLLPSFEGLEDFDLPEESKKDVWYKNIIDIHNFYGVKHAA